MWIFSKYGFFSVVDKDGDIHVRARKRGDLENLVEAEREARQGEKLASYEHPLPIHESAPPADYGFRLVVGRSAWTERLGPILIGSIDYSNFKSAIAANHGGQADKLPALHTIWSLMARYQDGERLTLDYRDGEDLTGYDLDLETSLEEELDNCAWDRREEVID